MPTRKQRRREAKSKRHEYEFVYVDDEGNEVDAPPAEEKSSNGARPAAKKSAPPARGGRGRTPQAPSWQRASRRALLLGAVVFVLFSFSSHNYVSALVPAVIYTVLFIPFTYAIDRFAYKRWQQRSAQAPTAKKK
ncbi:MAG: hypothetical protein ACRDL2_11745 [Gaiellaceae bacterium]|jgi:hypothetical protein